jgi:WD40 repeat protein
VIYEQSESSLINCISFSPWELGLKLLAGLEDGSVLLISYKTSWSSEKFQGHSCSITSLAWGSPLSLQTSSQEATFRFILGTSDGKLKVCTQFEASLESEVLEKHTGCITDVAWNPSMSSSKEIFASAAERVVIIWVKYLDDRCWKAKDILSFPGPVWKISWNILGNSLAISAADNYTRVVKENNEENWKVFQQISPKGEVTDLAES